MEDDILDPQGQVAETRALPIQTRELNIRAESFNETDSTVEVTFTTGARGARFDWNRWQMIDEELATDSANVRLDRLNRGAPVLNCHQRYELNDQIGVVVPGSARMEGGLGVATLQFSRREEIQPVIQDIRDGIIRNVSVGYNVFEYEVTEREGARPLYRAIDWEPVEISFVPVPFDDGAQVRSQEPSQSRTRCIIRRAVPANLETIMEEDIIVPVATPAAPITRALPAENPVSQPSANPAPVQPVTVSAIRTAVNNAGLDADVAFQLIERHEAAPFSRTALMAEIGTRFAERDCGATTISRAPAQVSTGVTMVRAMSEALAYRMSPKGELSQDAGQFRSMSMLRMAEELLGSTGISTRSFAPVEIAERVLHSTSDFPALMSNTLNRRLRMAYMENQQSYQRWARRAPNAPNFKSIDVVQLSAMPDMVKTTESGEFKYGTASDGKVSYSVATYGRIIGVTRQTIINDDLRALDRIASGFGASAARLENRIVYAQLTGNPVMPDGQTLFHASHGNLATAPGAIASATLSNGRKAMRKQKGLQSEELNIAPAYLIVPSDLEQIAYQFTSDQFVPATVAAINEFRSGGRTALEPIVETLLDGSSATAWYLAASNSEVDTVEYCYLEGSEGVQMSERIGFTVDGMEMKATLDFAAAVIDHRGLYKDNGV